MSIVVNTMQDLLNLATAGCQTPGATARVRGYSTVGDGGGGLFSWDPDSSAACDGVTAFAPVSRQSAQQTYTNQVTFLRSDRSESTRTLPHANIVFGSCEFVYATAGTFLSDWQLHGHGLAYGIDSGSNAIPHSPYFNHLAGKFVADGISTGQGQQRLMNLCAAHLSGGQDGVFTFRYKYATTGRWLRVLDNDEPITPAMIGCTKNNPAVNDYHRLAWLMIFAAQMKRPILFDAWYYYKGTLELQEGQVFLQTRPHSDAGLKVCPWTTIPVIDHLADGYDETQPAALLDYDTCGILPATGIKSFTWKGFCHHGNLDNNTQFLSDPDYETTDLSSPGTVSQMLRESPVWCGLGIILQSNRDITEVSVHLEDVQIGDFGGSCLLHAAYDRQIEGTNVRLGVSESGRVKYGGSGSWNDLWLYGYSRTAIERGYTETVNGHKFTLKRPDGTTPSRYWPENAVPANVSAMLGGGYIDGVDWDMTGSDCTEGMNIRGLGIETRGRIIGPETQFSALAVSTNGAIVSCTVDLDVYNNSDSGIAPINYIGGHHAGSKIRMRIHETYVDGVPKQVVPSLPDVPPIDGLVVGISNDTASADLEIQRLDAEIVSDMVHKNLLNLIGLAGNGEAVVPSDYVPTEIRLSGRILNATNKLMFADNGQGPAAGIGAIPVRVLCDSLQFNIHDPSIMYIGDSYVIDRCLEILILRHCSTPDGMTSEDGGFVDFTGADLTSNRFDIITKLMWRPGRVAVTPCSQKAAEFFLYVEVITVGSGATEDARRPKIRVHFSPSVSAGDVLKLSWDASVST